MGFGQNSTFGFAKTGTGQSSGSLFAELAVVCGEAGGPVAGLNTYQNDDLIGASGVNYIWVNKAAEQGFGPSPDFSFDSSTGTITRPGNIWVEDDTLYLEYIPA